MTTRCLYLVLAGGGAGGAYIAGVLTGLYRFLEENPADAKGRKIEIAGIAGTSAGALCGALFARALVDRDGGRLANLRRAWVREYDIDAIMARPPREVPPQGLFWAEGIVGVFRAMLDPPAATTAWAPFCADRLDLAFGTTNLDGIPHPISVRGAARAHAVRHRDALTYTFARGQEWETAYDEWLRVREEAPASSAFPVFFPPRTVPRRRDDYPDDAEFPDDARLERTTFIDGGLFVNEPVDLALAMARRHGRSAQVDVLMVDPVADYGRYSPPPRPLRISSLLRRTAEAMRHEASRGEWMSGAGGTADLHAVHPSHPLAGTFWNGFGGLFREDWREEDFGLGVTDGPRALAGVFGAEERPPAPSRTLPDHDRGPRAIPRGKRLRVGFFTLRRLWHILGAELDGFRRTVLRPLLLAFLLVSWGFWRLFRHE